MKKLIIAIIKNKSIILWFWIILFAFSEINLLVNKNNFESGIGEIKNSISKSVSDEIKNNFKEPFSNNVMFSFTSNKFNVYDQTFKQNLADFEDSLKKDSNIEKTFSFLNSPLTNLISDDKKTTLIFMTLKNQDFSFAESYTPKLREIAKNFVEEKKSFDDSLKIYLTGNGAYSFDMNRVSEIDGQKAEEKVLIFTFIILIFAFRSLGASLIAVISGFTASVITISMLKIITGFFSLTIICENISTMLGLALGIDYSLLLVTRYREERKKSSNIDAITTTVQYAGSAVLYSGITVLIGFSALFIPNMKITSSIGIGGVLVVFFSILVAITLTPVLLYTFEKYLDYPKFLSDFFKSKDMELERKWSYFIIKHNIPATLVTLFVLFLLIIPVFHIRLSEPEIMSMPDSMESKQGFLELQKLSSGSSMFPIYLLVKSKNDLNITENSNLINLYKLSEKLKKDSRIGKVYGITSLSNDFNLMYYILMFNTGISNDGMDFAQEYFVSKDLKSTIIQIFPLKSLSTFDLNSLVDGLRKNTFKDFEVKVGGPASVNYDLVLNLYGNFPYIIGFIYLVTVIFLAKAFRSLFIPLKAIILNTISVLASYGVLVIVFQYGYFQTLLGIKYSPESIVSAIPVILFCIMFSLSMDYEVFLLSRIYEDYQKTKDNNLSIVTGLSETSGVITKAALIMLVVFGAFTQADIILIKMTGVGLATAVFLDATLIRMILVPSFMKLAGKLNWYFPF